MYCSRMQRNFGFIIFNPFIVADCTVDLLLNMKMLQDVTANIKLLSTVQGSATNYDCPEQFFLPTKNGLWNLDDSQSWALWPKNPWHSQKIGAKLSHIISSLHTHKASNSKENNIIEIWKNNLKKHSNTEALKVS